MGARRRHTKRVKKVGERKQRGGLRGILYGGLYDPQSEAIRKAIDGSAKRVITSTIITGLKTASSIVGIGVGIGGVVMACISPMLALVNLAIGLGTASLSAGLNEKVNKIARTGIINMLNKYAVYNKDNSKDFSGILYPHIWKNIDGNNEYIVDSENNSTREIWLKSYKLPPDLSFDVNKIKTDKSESAELKEEVITTIKEIPDSDKKKLDENVKAILPVINETLEEQGMEPISETQKTITEINKIDEAVDLEKTFETGQLPEEIQEKIAEQDPSKPQGKVGGRRKSKKRRNMKTSRK
jgi:hypothetical protein